ncbi:MAG: glycoside hydrolase family 3 protein [Treponema sp.]|nr:glycoside hydrolase family 3 protein [Treponema sp.]
MKKMLLALCVISATFNFAFCKPKIIDKKQTKKELNNRKFALSVNDEIKFIKKNNENNLNDFLNGMSLEEKVSQMFIINLEGNKKFKPIDRMNGKPYVPGGYLFFSYNLGDTPSEVKEFTDDIKTYCEENDIIPPFLAVDEEGGWVQRLKKLAGKLPSQEEVALTKSISDAYEMYFEHARKMKDMGFHMNLAPVVEVLSDYNKDFLDGRSFGNLEQTITYSMAEMNGYQNNGIACVLKHFPGNTNTDPHTGLPEITLSKEEMVSALIPFGRTVNLRPKAVLMSHARTQVIDEEIPACFSYTWVTEKLRNEMGFEGIIFSDDIFMGALSKNGYPPEIACVKAVEAGVDCIMISEKRFLNPAQVLISKAKEDPAFADRIDESCRRILKYKIEVGIWQNKKN